jgi:hypothetical protein
MSQTLFVRRAGLETGPHPLKELKTMIRRGELSRIHEVSLDGKTWVYATEYPQLFDPKAKEEDLTPVIDDPPEDPVVAEPEPPAKDPVSLPHSSSNSPWWYEADNEPAGPVSLETLRDMIFTEVINMEDRVWTKGMADWEPARGIPALGDAPGSA